MVRIFKKQDKKKELPHDGRVQLADAARKLGFEVGYHRHSEIGWVQEKQVQLYNFADQYGLRDFVKENYAYGKEEGGKAKDRDTKSGLSKVSSSEKPETPPDLTLERNNNDPAISRNRSGYKRTNYDFASSSGMIQQPDLVELPENIERVKVVDRPAFLDGARHLTPKKK